MKKLGLFVLLCTALVWIQSCEKDEISSSADEFIAPELPPQESFIMPMPFADYDKVDTSEIVSGDLGFRSGPATYQHWFYAGFSLVGWNLVVGTQMALPVASFAAAFNVNPEHLGNGVYAWSYDVEVGNVTYSALLNRRV